MADLVWSFFSLKVTIFFSKKQFLFFIYQRCSLLGNGCSRLTAIERFADLSPSDSVMRICHQPVLFMDVLYMEHIFRLHFAYVDLSTNGK